MVENLKMDRCTLHVIRSCGWVAEAIKRNISIPEMAEEIGLMITVAWKKICQIQKYLHQKEVERKPSKLQTLKTSRTPGSSPQGLHS